MSPETATEPRPKNREVLWLTSRLARGRRMRFTETIMVTPGLAVAMLGYHVINRPIRSSHVRLHIQRLERGEFILTHQGIAFANNDALTDGRHRLTAIRDSGVAAKLQVTFGCDPEEFRAIDQPRTRTAGDMLSILGEQNTILRASIARLLLGVEKETMVLDPQMVVDHAVTLRSKTMDSALKMGIAMRQITTPTAVAVGYFLIKETTRQKQKAVEDFWVGLASGEGLKGPRLRLREWLRSVPPMQNRSSIACWRAAGIISAWNAVVEGKSTFSTKWPHTAKLPRVL